MKLTETHKIQLHWLAVDWGFTSIDAADSSYAREEFSYQEALLHEACHAVEAGLRMGPDMTPKISDYFYKLNDANPILGLVHELHVLAIEHHVLKEFGCLNLVDMGKFLKFIWANGFSGPALPLGECKTLYERFRKSKGSRELAYEVVDSIETLLKERE